MVPLKSSIKKQTKTLFKYLFSGGAKGHIRPFVFFNQTLYGFVLSRRKKLRMSTDDQLVEDALTESDRVRSRIVQKMLSAMDDGNWPDAHRYFESFKTKGLGIRDRRALMVDPRYVALTAIEAMLLKATNGSHEYRIMAKILILDHMQAVSNGSNRAIQAEPDELPPMPLELKRHFNTCRHAIIKCIDVDRPRAFSFKGKRATRELECSLARVIGLLHTLQNAVLPYIGHHGHQQPLMLVMQHTVRELKGAYHLKNATNTTFMHKLVTSHFNELRKAVLEEIMTTGLRDALSLPLSRSD